jgi:hypothetical protein
MTSSINRSSSSDANVSSASQEILRLIMEPAGSLAYYVQTSQLLVSILNQNPINILSLYLIKIHFNITPQSISRASK